MAVVFQRIASQAEARKACTNTGVAFTTYHYSNWANDPRVPNVLVCLR